MSKEYERIRIEVHKKYKGQIEELERTNNKLMHLLQEKEAECKELKRQLYAAENARQSIQTPLGRLGILGGSDLLCKLITDSFREGTDNEYNETEVGASAEDSSETQAV